MDELQDYERIPSLVDGQMRAKDKKVLLLMDNSSAYEVAVEQMEEIKALTNTKVKWLPPHATSVYQPLDQGIIQTGSRMSRSNLSYLWRRPLMKARISPKKCMF